MSKAKTIAPLLKAWNSCRVDQEGDGGKIINCALLENASTLLYQHKLQQTVDKLLNSGRMEKLEEYIDLNYKMHTVATLSYGEIERDGMDEFHLLGIPWSGTEADFKRYQDPEFRTQLQERINQHLVKLLTCETKDKNKPRFDCEMGLNLIDADIFGSSSSDARKAILDEFAEQGTITFTVQEKIDDQESGSGHQGHHRRRGDQWSQNQENKTKKNKAKKIHTKLIVVGLGCAETDFTEDFVLNDVLLNHILQSEVWKGTTLSGGCGSTILPPLPINSASLFALSQYIKDFMWNQQEVERETIMGSYEMDYSPFEEILTLHQGATNSTYALEIPRKWFFACGLNSIGILKSSLEIDDEEGDEDTGLEDPEGPTETENALELQLEGGGNKGFDPNLREIYLEGERRPRLGMVDSEEERAWNEELDQILPSFWDPKKHTVN